MLRLLLAGLVLGVSAFAAPYSSLFFFGDSLTDTGNVYKATSVLSRYTFGLVPRAPASPYVNGHFTNGPVWAQETAARLGHAGDAEPAGMSLGWFGQIGGQGNNYAVGGARTDTTGALGFFDFAIPTGIAEQVQFYISRTNGTADPNALYFILGAGNDLRDAAKIADPAQRAQAAVQAGINLAYSVRDLYLAGARNFVLINSPDVGLIPETLSAGNSAAGTDASVQFNTWLGLYANYLETQVPGFSLEYFDLFGLHHELVNEYGLAAVRACKGAPAGSCDTSLFFDSVHPTSWVHTIIGDRIADEILGVSSVSGLQFDAPLRSEVPEPSTLMLAGVGVVVIEMWRRRRAA